MPPGGLKRLKMGARRLHAPENLQGQLETVERKERSMATTTLIRIAAGVLFVIVLVLLIQRRRTRVK